MDYAVILDKFQGPFDLLFYLIEKNEIDIQDIPIFEITKQYLEYLHKMNEFNMNITSEFILMASTLIEIKSKMLLPSVVEEEDPRESLINQLIEYKLFKEASEQLRNYEENQSYYVSKPQEDFEYNDNNLNDQLIFNEIHINDLMNIFQNLMKNNIIQIEKEEIKIYKDNYSVQECVEDILEILKSRQNISLIELFETNVTKHYVVVVFLSILELSKLKSIKILQDEIFGDINLQYCT